MAFAAQRLGKLLPTRTALLVVDVQEKFRPAINGLPAVIETARRLVRGANVIGLPVVVTEQYPRGLGPTVRELGDVLNSHAKVVQKTSFSAAVPHVTEVFDRHAALRQVLLLGVEAHVCVLQSALDLLERGLEVHLVVDGVASARAVDRSVAIARLATAGVVLTTADAALFQLLGDAGAPDFKEVSALVKEARSTEQLPFP